MKSLRFLAALVIAAVAFGLLPPPQAIHALDTGSFYRKVEIQVQSSKVDANLTDFPILITEDSIPNEACDADGSTPAQNGGGDIRFSADAEGANQLPLEVVSFVTDNNPANCIVEMWVKAPFISSSTGASVWMWYNTDTSDTQPASSNTYGSENVWNSNYAAVWHLQETSGTRYDSTSNSNDLADNNTVTSTTGKFGGNAATFDDSNNEFLHIADNASLSMGSSVDWFISSWVRLHDTSSYHTIASKYEYDDGNREFTIEYVPTATDRIRIQHYHSYAGDYILGTNNSLGSPSANTWYHVGLRHDSGGATIEIASNNGTKDSTSHGGDTYDGGSRFVVGANDAHDGTPNDLMDGDIDEVRAMKEAVSNAWWKAEYENTNDPGSFVVEQTPENVGVTLASIRKSSDENVSSSTTLQDDDHLMVSLQSNKSYVVNGVVFATSTSAAPDIKFGFTVPTGATMDIGYISHNIDGNPTVRAGLLESSGVASEAIPIRASDVVIIQVMGTIELSSTAGDLKLQWAQNQSNGTATTVKEGSFLSISETAG